MWRGVGVRGRAKMAALLYKPRTFLSFLASELRLGSLGLCVVINGNLKQRELTISFFISLRPPSPSLPRVGRAPGEIQLSLRSASPPSCLSLSLSAVAPFVRGNETRVHRTRARLDALMMNVARCGARLKCRARFIYTAEAEEKKILETFSHRRGKLLREDLLFIAACLFLRTSSRLLEMPV